MVIAPVIGLEAITLLWAIGLYNPRRNEWASRLITGLVFAAYVIDEMVEVRTGRPLLLRGSREEESLRNALLGLHLIGWSSIKFAFSGFDALGEHPPQKGDDSQTALEPGPVLEIFLSWHLQSR